VTDSAPFPGKLKVGDHGPAVHAVQQALEDFGVKRHKLHPTEQHLRLYPPTGVFRLPTAYQCGHAQEVYGLTKTNTYGPELHAKLAPHFNAQSRELLTRLHRDKQTAAFRVELTKMAHNTAGYMLDRTRRPGWTYEMNSLRMSILRHGWDFDTVLNATEDCSSGGGTMIEIAARRTGLPDPLWAGPWFYTGNMIGFGRHVALADIRVGDRVHYGNNSHLGVFMGFVQGTPAVWSFGGEPGPVPHPLGYRGIYGIRRDYE
jgi:hypothetical protein